MSNHERPTLDYTFLIGATGLLGRYLLRDLLEAGTRVAVLVRPTPKQTGRDRIEGILQDWESQSGKSLPRPVCLDGDISQEWMGLSQDSRNWVAEHCGSMIHSAAVLTFAAEGDGEPWKTNVGGTRNALATCQETGLSHFHYVSTAYVCGLRDGVIREVDLDLGQGFRNDYESSKLQAEALVQEANFLDSRTIYRPAVIAGDSKTGYTNTYHGLYLYLKLMSVLVWNTEPGPDGVRETPVRLSMTGDEPRNIVPVDWVSQVICHLFQNEAAHGQTYHIAPSQPITPREVIEAGYTYFNSRGVEFSPSPASTKSPISEMDRNAHENMTIYKTYEVSDPHFDTTNLSRFAADLPCPQIDEAMLHRYWKYGEADRWGKRRPTQANYADPVGDSLRSAVASINATGDPRLAGGLQDSIGLDITGANGGQWTVRLNPDRQISVHEGIQPDCSNVLRMPAALIRELLTLDEKDLALRLPELGNHVHQGDREEALADIAVLLFRESSARAEDPISLLPKPAIR
jgi:thioester reductase-like protein